MMSRIKLLVLDLDGTLTNSKKEVTKRSRDALMKAQEKGIKIVLASGRSPYGILPLARELELDRYGSYILAFNGGHIMDCRTGEVLYQNCVKTEFNIPLLELAEEYGVASMSYKEDVSAIYTSFPDHPLIQFVSRNNHLPIHYIEDMKSVLTWPVPKFLYLSETIDMGEVEADMQRRFEGKLSCYRSEDRILDIMPLGVDKAASLTGLLKVLHLSPEEMAAAGDSYNDVGMIRMAGLGIAMANAVPEAKEAADVITLSNDEDGVADAVEKLLL